MASETEPAGFRVTVIPTEAGIRRPVAYANTAQIVGDPTGLTLYFFSTPADANRLPEAQKQLDAQRTKGETQPQMTLEIDPVAKVFIPLEFGEVLVQTLAQNVQLWKRLRELAMAAPATEPPK